MAHGGGLIVIDDYGSLEGAKRAADEVFGDKIEISPRGRAWVRF